MKDEYNIDKIIVSPQLYNRPWYIQKYCHKFAELHPYMWGNATLVHSIYPQSSDTVGARHSVFAEPGIPLPCMNVMKLQFSFKLGTRIFIITEKSFST